MRRELNDSEYSVLNWLKDGVSDERIEELLTKYDASIDEESVLADRAITIVQEHNERRA